MTPGLDKVLVVASAGNTSRSFASVCSDNNIPLLICVPEDNLGALWFEKPLNDCVKLISTVQAAITMTPFISQTLLPGWRVFP